MFDLCCKWWATCPMFQLNPRNRPGCWMNAPMFLVLPWQSFQEVSIWHWLQARTWWLNCLYSWRLWCHCLYCLVWQSKARRPSCLGALEGAQCRSSSFSSRLSWCHFCANGSCAWFIRCSHWIIQLIHFSTHTLPENIIYIKAALIHSTLSSCHGNAFGAIPWISSQHSACECDEQ